MEDIWLMPRRVRSGAVDQIWYVQPLQLRNLWSQDSCKLAPHCRKFTFKTGSDPPGWNFGWIFFNKQNMEGRIIWQKQVQKREHTSLHQKDSLEQLICYPMALLISRFFGWPGVLDPSCFSMAPKKRRMKGCSQQVLSIPSIPHCRRVRPGKSVRPPARQLQALAFCSTQWTTLRIGMPKTMPSVALFLATFPWTLGCRDVEIDEDLRKQKMTVVYSTVCIQWNQWTRL